MLINIAIELLKQETLTEIDSSYVFDLITQNATFLSKSTSFNRIIN